MDSTIIGILIAGLMMFFGIFASKEAYHANKEKKEAQKEAQKAHDNAEELKQYTEKLNEENKKKTEKVQEVSDAKTKEELRTHARKSASDNNDKLCSDDDLEWEKYYNKTIDELQYIITLWEYWGEFAESVIE